MGRAQTAAGKLLTQARGETGEGVFGRALNLPGATVGSRAATQIKFDRISTGFTFPDRAHEASSRASQSSVMIHSQKVAIVLTRL